MTQSERTLLHEKVEDGHRYWMFQCPTCKIYVAVGQPCRGLEMATTVAKNRRCKCDIDGTVGDFSVRDRVKTREGGQKFIALSVNRLTGEVGVVPELEIGVYDGDTKPVLLPHSALEMNWDP